MSNNVVMMSLWQNDADKYLANRAHHLLQKHHYGNIRWVWVVGDSQDDTEKYLRQIARHYYMRDIQIIHHDTGIVGSDPQTRLKRLSETVNAGLDQVRPSDDYWLLHESDLLSPPNLIDRFLTTGKCPIAGWVTLTVGETTVFYDTWAYRKDGQLFSNYPPYHPCYRPDALFEVDSVGSCWMIHADDIRAGIRCQKWACLDLCQQLRARGRQCWVDPTLPIIQPAELWTSQEHAATV